MSARARRLATLTAVLSALSWLVAVPAPVGAVPSPIELKEGSAVVDGTRDAAYARVSTLTKGGKTSGAPGFAVVADVYMLYDPTGCDGTGKLFVFVEMLDGRTIDRRSELNFFADLNGNGKRDPGESLSLSGAVYNASRTGVEFGICYACDEQGQGVGLHVSYSNAGEKQAGRTARFPGAPNSGAVALLIACPSDGGGGGGPGSITINKQVECPAQFNPLDFYTFTTAGSGLSDFVLDGNGDGGQPSTTTFSNLSPGTYMISESVTLGPTHCAIGHVRDTSGTVVPTISCSPGGIPSSSFDGSTVVGTATVTLVSDAAVTCTFINVQYGDTTGGPGQGEIWITKVVQCGDESNPLDFYTFTTAGSGLSDFVLDGNGDEVQPSTRFFSNLQPGTYTVSESVTLGPTSCAIGQLEDESGNIIGPTITCELGRGGGTLEGVASISFPTQDPLTVVGSATFTLPTTVGVACTFYNVAWPTG